MASGIIELETRQEGAGMSQLVCSNEFRRAGHPVSLAEATQLERQIVPKVVRIASNVGRPEHEAV